MKLIRKITIKEIVGNVGKGDNFKRLVAQPRDAQQRGETVWFLDILGSVTGLKSGATDLGEFCKLLGTFEATNLETGEVHRSGCCILPNFLGDQLASAVSGADSPVTFGVRIGAHYDDQAAMKFVYDTMSLSDTSQNDPLAALKAERERALLALGAPANDPAQAAAEPAAETKPATAARTARRAA